MSFISLIINYWLSIHELKSKVKIDYTCVHTYVSYSCQFASSLAINVISHEKYVA